MRADYHIQITTQALEDKFSRRALEAIIEANRGQDRLAGLLWHPEYHFEDNKFTQAYAYVDEQRQMVLKTLETGQPPEAWAAFGRLLHNTQDFYAHSNYVRLWMDRYGSPERQSTERMSVPPSAIEPLDPEILSSPELATCRSVYPWDALAYFPALEPLARRFAPPDSHTHLNLDTPASGPLFEYALAAAQGRTLYEYESLSKALHSQALVHFKDC